jgi:hypothetical protein
MTRSTTPTLGEQRRSRQVAVADLRCDPSPEDRKETQPLEPNPNICLSSHPSIRTSACTPACLPALDRRYRAPACLAAHRVFALALFVRRLLMPPAVRRIPHSFF